MCIICRKELPRRKQPLNETTRKETTRKQPLMLSWILFVNEVVLWTRILDRETMCILNMFFHSWIGHFDIFLTPEDVVNETSKHVETIDSKRKNMIETSKPLNLRIMSSSNLPRGPFDLKARQQPITNHFLLTLGFLSLSDARVCPIFVVKSDKSQKQKFALKGYSNFDQTWNS